MKKIFFALVIAFVSASVTITALSIINAEEYEPPYYENPHDAIIGELDHIGHTPFVRYSYNRSIYKFETENEYIEFFVSDLDSNEWYFALDKIDENGVIKYKVDNFGSPISAVQVDTKDINDRYKFIVKQTLEETENFDCIETIPFELNTDKGTFNYYLCIIKK